MKKVMGSILFAVMVVMVYAYNSGPRLYDEFLGADTPPPQAVPGEIITSKFGIYYLPKKYTPEKTCPLVVVLHPMGSTPEQFISDNALARFADTRGYILCGTRNRHPAMAQMGDVRQVRRMVSFMKHHFNVDRKKVLLTGFSLGGHFCHIFLPYNYEGVLGNKLFTAYAAGSGGEGLKLEEMMRDGTCPGQKVPGYVYWGRKELARPGKKVTAFLKGCGWNIVTAEHDGYHWIPEGAFEKIFDWFDAL